MPEPIGGYRQITVVPDFPTCTSASMQARKKNLRSGWPQRAPPVRCLMHKAMPSWKMNLHGKLTWSAIPFDQPIVMGASGGVVLVIIGILGWVTLKGYVPYLWREWITSVDHKRIGVMYIVLGLLMLL